MKYRVNFTFDRITTYSASQVIELEEGFEDKDIQAAIEDICMDDLEESEVFGCDVENYSVNDIEKEADND